MRQEEIDKIIDERWDSAPEKLRGLLESDHIDTVLSDLASKHGLDGNLTDKLDNCITFVILGLTQPKDFIRSIGETLGVDAQKASAIGNEVNERVFRAVREDLKMLYGIKDEIPSKPRSIDAELTEHVGLKPPPVPVPVAPKPKPLDAELSESMRKPPVPPPPMAPKPRPAPSFVPPPPKPQDVERETLNEQGGVPSGQAMYRGISNQNPPTPNIEPAQTQNPWQRPPVPQAPRPAPVPPKPRVFENNYGESREEDLSREQILREIENPSSIKPRPSTNFNAPLSEPPKEYNADPYREPLN